MAVMRGILEGKVMHKRMQPKVHRFVYRVFYLCFSLHEKQALRAPFFSLNRFNLYSYYDRDHGLKDGSDPGVWLRSILGEYGIDQADGDIILMTQPRVLGYVFNPVSFWFCLDQHGALRAVLAEVNNTFNETHSYLLAHADQRPITQDDILTSDKVFHVSPFLKVEGRYRFRFAYGEEAIGVWIDYDTEAGETLKTSVVGQRMPITPYKWLTLFVRYPLITLKVIGLIHYQAVRLVMKGIRYIPKPHPPENRVSR